MGIRAEWRLAELEADASDDPFDNVILTTGLTVDLRGGEAAVHDAIRQTLQLESRLFDRGVGCDLKDNGQDCLTCEVFTNDPHEARAPLCVLGRDQHTLLHRAEEMQTTRQRPYKALGTAYASMAALARPYERTTLLAV